jgi:hypothetical protein
VKEESEMKSAEEIFNESEEEEINRKKIWRLMAAAKIEEKRRKWR